MGGLIFGVKPVLEFLFCTGSYGKESHKYPVDAAKIGQFLKVREQTSQLYYLIELVTWPWGPVACLYKPRGFKQPTKPTLKVGGAGLISLIYYANCKKNPGHSLSSELFRREHLRPVTKSIGQMATEKWSQISPAISVTLRRINTWFDLALLNPF
jgi:hypothetical protein